MMLVSQLIDTRVMKGSSLYALRNVSGKGKGLVAIEDIPKGTRILSEQPLITTPERQRTNEWLKKHISQQVDTLNEHQRQLFLSMHNLYPYQSVADKYLGIFRTNGLPVEANGVGGGIFLEACRINHACDNNAQKHWNQYIKRHTVHALRDIAKGEEITIYYLGLDSSRTIRQKKLLDKFGFLCSCRLCSLPTNQSQETDKRLNRIDQLDDLIGRDCRGWSFSLRTLGYADERVRLCNEGPGNSGMARTYLDATQIAIANGDLARGRIFAERAVEVWRTAYGSDSEEVVKYSSLARNPAELPLYGLSMEWKTSSDDVPQDLDPNDFEDWLWRRQKPKKRAQLEQFANLRNRAIFPSFAALPRSKSDLDWYEEVDGTYQALRHWCFLGEIANSITLHHLELELTDIDDKKVPLHFYTEGLGKEMAPARIQKGYTVAVRHGKRSVFMYGDPGIRHEDPEMLKVGTSNPYCEPSLVY
ncbi:hypothetical protein SLS60_011053 [Paraconiothyrium brasiliense]|uniref:SET domain-containing protein n=1 Tax=Paraconiothyrium brasiliense TaxID=300254 RepID=A0ABR3QKF8_9PLEO